MWPWNGNGKRIRRGLFLWFIMDFISSVARTLMEGGCLEIYTEALMLLLHMVFPSWDSRTSLAVHASYSREESGNEY